MENKELILLTKWHEISDKLLASGDKLPPELLVHIIALHNETALFLEPETRFRSSLDGVNVRSNVWELFDEIKQYTQKNPGNITPADLADRLMFGFIHTDGTYWVIKITDLKKTFDSKPNDPIVDITRTTFTNQYNKAVLCAMLSGKDYEVWAKEVGYVNNPTGGPAHI